MKSKAWYIKLPGEVYVYGLVRFDTLVSEGVLRQWVRNWLNSGKRLPYGTEVWPANS